MAGKAAQNTFTACRLKKKILNEHIKTKEGYNIG